MVALWYRYRDGSLECATWANADVVGYLRNDSELARWLLDDEREEVRIRIQPRALHSWDYTDRMREVVEGT